MLPIHTILHPTDFSERSEPALRLAGALSRDYGAHLIVLHVAVPPPLLAYGEGYVPPETDAHLVECREQLRQLSLPDTGGIRAERRLLEGDPATEIVREARDIHADLIVMGTHGRTGLARLLMGSVAEQVVRQAPCPVLTMKSPFPEAVPAESAVQPETVMI